MRVVLYNDTSLINSHFGPQLVVQTAREQLAKRGMELIATFHRDATPNDHLTHLRQADLVIVNGEGSIHHGKCAHLIEIANDYPAVLINCVYQQNEPNEALAKFRLIAARESRSAKHLYECGATRVEIVPDLMFAARLLQYRERGSPMLDLGMTDNVTDRESGYPPFTTDPANYLTWLTQHRRIACGRYHAAVACCALGIPFSCWPSNTWKIEGMLDDIGLPHLIFATQDLAVQNCPLTFDADARRRIENYVSSARSKIDRLFDMLSNPGQLLN